MRALVSLPLSCTTAHAADPLQHPDRSGSQFANFGNRVDVTAGPNVFFFMEGSAGKLRQATPARSASGD